MTATRMSHDTAFDLVCRHAPAQAGMLWDTTNHTGCDTAWAVADQYAEDEQDAAIAALAFLALGWIPAGWEPHHG